MDNQHDIQEILQGCLSKDPAAQRALVDRCADRLYAICIRYMGDRDNAKDSLQESFIRIFKYIDRYDPSKGNFDAWANTVTIRQCLKTLGAKGNQNVQLIPEITEMLKDDPSVIDQLQTEELLKIVQALPDGYRQIFNLYVIEGYSHKEIAAMVGIEEVSSRSRLSRAKELLRQKLDQLKKQETWIKVG